MAVLFLFVVMMLDINFVELRQGFLQYLPIGALVGLVLLAELVMIFGSWSLLPRLAIGGSADAVRLTKRNTHASGQSCIPTTFYLFQVAGLILLVAMIGAIVLTLRSA